LEHHISVFGEMDIISVFETEGGSSILSRPAIKEYTVKSITFKNKFNGERVVCKDIKAVQVIDGVEYLLVTTLQNRTHLMRKDALEKVS
jgi:hypothetical protein